jgi:catechol 2,3-dioxygenase-like lactoylglutathione lyase family enzyme
MARNAFSIAPLFMVSDLLKSLDYYCDVLGFRRPRLWGDPPSFAMPDREGLIIMLQQEKDVELIRSNYKKCGAWDAYFWVNDARALFEDFKAKGAKFHYEPTYRELYGNLEFAVLDPDGYLMAFGQDVGEAPE